MEHQDLANASAVLGAIGAPVLLLARNRIQLLTGLVVLVIGEAGLAYALVPDAPAVVVESSLRIAALLAAAIVVAAVAAVLVRFPAAAPVALIVAAPFRLSVGLGKEQAFLLVPFYVLLAAACVALGYRVVRGAAGEPISPLIGIPASALVGLAGLSLLWAHDLRAGTIELVFFYFPFSALLAVVSRAPIRSWSWRALATALVAVTSVFAAIGVYQAWSHTEILAKQDIQLANAHASFFRVTSLFQDPSVYGRHLVLGMVVLLSVLMLGQLRPAVGIPLMCLLAAGLYFSYSQTSFTSLFAAVLVVTLIAGDRTTRRVAVGTAAALVAVGAVLVFVSTNGDSANKVTRDRLPLARLTVPVYLHHPIAGVGVGSQPLVSRREEDAKLQKSKNVSHTTPLTVGAELGTIGLLVYLGFLAALGRAILLTLRRHQALGLVLAGSLTALVVQSLTYGGFFEDPFVWGIAGLAAAALMFFVPEPAPAAARAERGAAAPHVDPLPARPPATPG
jgi:hypothetical protein